jgi:hypothetical protein
MKSKTWSVYADDGERLIVVAETMRRAISAVEVIGKNPVAVMLVGDGSVIISGEVETEGSITGAMS